MWWTDAVPPWEQPTFLRLAAALLLGTLIGIERQWRQRAAGLRTNALVCFGAAAFVDLGTVIGGSQEIARVVSYVVSGVGFLGAGAIIKDAQGIRGLNTAATLWCSAAVGACAGAGQLLDALYVTALLIVINLLLRPMARMIDSRAMAQPAAPAVYNLSLICDGQRESEVRNAVLQTIAKRPIALRELQSEETPGGTIMRAELEAPVASSADIEQLVDRLQAIPHIRDVEWSMRPGISE